MITRRFSKRNRPALCQRLVQLEDDLLTVIDGWLAGGPHAIGCHGCRDDQPCLACRVAEVVARNAPPLEDWQWCGMSHNEDLPEGF